MYQQQIIGKTNITVRKQMVSSKNSHYNQQHKKKKIDRKKHLGLSKNGLR